MFTKRRDTQGPANLYAAYLTIYCSRDSMATTLQIGLVCRTVIELADVRFYLGFDLDEPYDMVSKLVASNLSTKNQERVKPAMDWGYRRCKQAEEKGVLGVTYLSDGETNRRLKYYFLTEAGEREFDQLQAKFELAYLKPEADIIGFGLIRRN